MVGCVCVYLRAEVLLCKHLKVMRVVTRDERTAVGKEERGAMGKGRWLEGQQHKHRTKRKPTNWERQMWNVHSDLHVNSLANI